MGNQMPELQNRFFSYPEVWLTCFAMATYSAEQGSFSE